MANKTKIEFIRWIDSNLPVKLQVPKTADDFHKLENGNPSSNIVSEEVVRQVVVAKQYEEEEDDTAE